MLSVLVIGEDVSMETNTLIILSVILGGFGFIIGWFGAWVAGAFKSLSEEERRRYERMNKCEEWR